MGTRTDRPGLSIEQSLGYQVNLAAKAFGSALGARLPAGLTTTQFGLIAHLMQQPGRSQREIAAATGIDTATLAEMLRRLESRGQVRRETDPEDARRTLVYPGDVDPDLIATAARAAADVNARATAGLTEEERTALIPLLIRLRENLEAS